MNVKMHIPVVRIDEIETETNSRTEIQTHTETTLVIRHDVTANPNFDYYLQPKADLLYDYIGTSGKIAYGGVKFNVRDEEPWIEFSSYAGELREAAKKRASEDGCHELQTLASWFSQARDRYETLATHLSKAIEKADDEHPDAEYHIQYGGGANEMEDTTDGSLGGKI